MEPYVGQVLERHKPRKREKKGDTKSPVDQYLKCAEVTYVNRRHHHYQVRYTYSDGNGYSEGKKYTPGN